VIVGVGLSLVAVRLLSTELFETSFTDPVALLGSAGSLFVTAVLASYLPGNRRRRSLA
jgi:hypothetical protein